MKNTNADQVRAWIAALNAGEDLRAAALLHPDIVSHDSEIAAGPDRRGALVRAARGGGQQSQIVRLLEDEEFVMAQMHSSEPEQDSFAVYRFSEKQIAETWTFTNASAPPNQSGHTQLDGPREPQDLANTDSNKRFVRSYYERFHLAGDRAHNQDFFTGDVMTRHEAGVRDGLRHFLHDVEHLMQHRTIDRIKLLVGQGDLVFLAAEGTHEGKPCAYIDLYRVEQQKLVEHWGFPLMLPLETSGRAKAK